MARRTGGLPVVEVAAQLGISPSMVAKVQAAALEKFRTRLLSALARDGITEGDVHRILWRDTVPRLAAAVLREAETVGAAQATPREEARW